MNRLRLAILQTTLVLIPACGCLRGWGRGDSAGGCHGAAPSPPSGASASTNSAGGTPAASVTFTCPMHAEVVSSSPGS